MYRREPRLIHQSISWLKISGMVRAELISR